eukprot:scaffold424_cov165-Ochromonas_danica.AAC.8
MEGVWGDLHGVSQSVGHLEYGDLEAWTLLQWKMNQCLCCTTAVLIGRYSYDLTMSIKLMIDLSNWQTFIHHNGLKGSDTYTASYTTYNNNNNNNNNNNDRYTTTL